MARCAASGGGDAPRGGAPERYPALSRRGSGELDGRRHRSVRQGSRSRLRDPDRIARARGRSGRGREWRGRAGPAVAALAHRPLRSSVLRVLRGRGSLLAGEAGGIDLLVRARGGGGASFRGHDRRRLREAAIPARPGPLADSRPAPARLARGGARAPDGCVPARGEVPARAFAGAPRPGGGRGARRNRRRPGGAARGSGPGPGRDPERSRTHVTSAMLNELSDSPVPGRVTSGTTCPGTGEGETLRRSSAEFSAGR